MKTNIKRVLFSLLIVVQIYVICKALDVPLFIIGWWCAIIFKLCEQEVYFLLFPRQQKYVIRFTNKWNKYLHEWLTSMNPDDLQVKSKKKEIALRFDNEHEARTALESIQQNGGAWDLYYADVKKYYN